MEMSASEPAQGDEEEDAEPAASEHKLTSDTGRRGRLLKTSFTTRTLLWMTQALKLKRTVEEGLVTYRNIFREMKKAKQSDRNYDVFPQLHPVCLPILPPLPLPPEWARPVPPLPPQPTQCEDDKDEGLYDDPLPLNAQQIIFMPYS